MLTDNLLFSSNFHVYYNIESLSKPKEIREQVKNYHLLQHKSDDNLLLDPSPRAHNFDL